MIKADDCFSHTRWPFPVFHVMRRNDVTIQHTKAVNPNKVTGIWTSFVWRDTSFVDKMKALVNYAGALELEYDTKFVHSELKDIVDDTKCPIIFLLPAQGRIADTCALPSWESKITRFSTFSKPPTVSVPVKGRWPSRMSKIRFGKCQSKKTRFFGRSAQFLRHQHD